MNANPANCDCERCDINRERALYQRAWLTAFREATTAQVSAALDAVENGRHRDSPEANGALLALTGLIMEKDSELSGAVVGRATRQQDQGEQSPMAAAEMERRIGLMGRLNDAAARLRPQAEPEVADHDAELWYAACFACITSLQVVRLLRGQRAELPQRDPMREAYLVVLTQLVGDAEASRERLEDTAIPDIDDGLADARGALLAEAHAAIDEMAETVDADLRAFNQDLPVEIRPAMRGLPAVTERAAAMVIGPADFHVGRFDEWDPNPPHAAGGLYIVYYYRGAKVVQSILDTYPMGFPAAAAAQQQVDRVIGVLLEVGPEEETLSDLLLPYALLMSDLADAGLHDVAGDRCSEFVSALQQQDLRHGAMREVLAAVAGDEPDVSDYLLRDSDFVTEFATVRQARAIITTARRQGLDSVKLSKLAAAMGHEAEELGVTPPSTDYATVSILLGAARAAGLPHEAIDRIYQAIDPDGYEEERYEQAVDLLEFGGEDGALDGLPRFDGEFSR